MDKHGKKKNTTHDINKEKIMEKKVPTEAGKYTNELGGTGTQNTRARAQVGNIPKRGA